MTTYEQIPTYPIELEEDGPSIAGAAALARELAADPRRWRHLVRFGAGDQRWYATLPTDQPYEVWLISWLPGQRTELHDHGESLGAFAVAEGALTETTLRWAGGDGVVRRGQAGLPVTRVDRFYRPGRVRAFGSDHLHQVRNDGHLPAVSVHAYAPALAEMTQYAVEDGRLRIVASDRAGTDW